MPHQSTEYCLGRQWAGRAGSQNSLMFEGVTEFLELLHGVVGKD
jgi:hypothetical protein